MEKQGEEISRLRKAVAELSALNDLSASVNSAMTVDDICMIIVRSAIEYMDASQGAIFILSEEESREELFKTFVRASDGSNEAIPFHLNELIKEMILRYRKPVLANPGDRDSELHEDLLKNQGISSLLAVPLFGRGDIIGIMIMFNKKHGQLFDQDDVRFLSILGSQSAKSLENLMLFRQIQDRHMKTIAKLVAGFSHEFNNPIGAIVGAADTLSRSAESLKKMLSDSHSASSISDESIKRSSEALTRSLAVIQSGKSRVENVLRRLRDFINLDQAKKRVVNINDCLDNCIKLLDYKIDPQKITILKNFGPECISTDCVPAQINQVFFDVLENAIESITGVGLIEITTSCQDDFIEVVVKDSGKGIDTDILPRIFDPGISTKNVDMGLGIGLPLCNQILKSHGGSITIDTQPGEGTSVSINIPANLKLPV
ncbi:MAG: GAF domain-containing protein [candidate division Zixibacteria bacterium]|nr:GAF domain-containing protein [candidate division Zixibacteria bacterium]